MKSYRNFLFDFDLTLADSSKGIILCYTNVLKENGYLNVSTRDICRTIGKTLVESFHILTGISDPQKLEDLRHAYTRQADIHMNRNTVFFEDALRMLPLLKDRGCGIGVISTKYRFRIQAVFGRDFPGLGLPDLIIGGEDVSHPKPHRESVDKAMERSGWKLQETLYVGDSTVDAQTAMNGGMDFCGILHGFTSTQELSCYPHVGIIRSLDELSFEDKRP